VRLDEGTSLKAIRLAALREAPSAFGSTYRSEAALDDGHWERRASIGSAGDAGATYLAVVDDCVVGLAAGFRSDASVGDVDLVSMWVDPSVRRMGIARRLVDAVVCWAAATGAASVNLWVTRGNDAAAALYEAAGFVETGDHQPLPSDPCRDEVRMTRRDPER